MREKIRFRSGGDECVGWYYRPDGEPKGKLAAIAMAHGLSGVKEMDLERFADAFSQVGVAVLLFDYRTFGESTGEPRGQLFPQIQTEDYRNALTWLSLRPEVNADALGIWGTSMSGAHVLHLAAYDKRVRCVVSQVPTVNLLENVRRVTRPEEFQGWLQAIDADRIHRMQTGQSQRIPVMAPPGTLCLVSDAGTREELSNKAVVAPNWCNEVVAESMEKLLEYNPSANVHLISPTPLLMIVATGDQLTPPDQALAAYSTAREPKSLLLLQGAEHHAVYNDPELCARAIKAAQDFMAEHLIPLATA